MRTLTVVACMLVCSTALAESRTWKTTSGGEIEGEYLRTSFGIVVIRRPEGKEARVQLARLSPEDREYLKQAGKKKRSSSAGTSAPKPPPTSPGDPEVVALMLPGQTLKRTAAGENAVPYHLYVPTTFKSDSAPPLIIAFSASGKGDKMVKRLKKSAEKAGWLVVGCDTLSNKIKDPEGLKLEDEVLDDILRCIPHRTDRLCLAGMSGGAMRAYSLLVEKRRKEHYFAVLAFGGWLGGRSYQSKAYRSDTVIAQINGDKDKAANSWLKKDAVSLEKRGCVVRAFSFPGGHTMGPPETIDEAITWILEERKKLDELRKKRVRRR